MPFEAKHNESVQNPLYQGPTEHVDKASKGNANATGIQFEMQYLEGKHGGSAPQEKSGSKGCNPPNHLRMHDIFGQVSRQDQNIANSDSRVTGAIDTHTIRDKPPEIMAARAIMGAIESGEPKEIARTLSNLAQNEKLMNNPKFLAVLNKQLEQYSIGDGSGPAFIRLEHGTGRNGEPVVQLALTKNDSWSKSSGSTTLSIGSDGAMSARRYPPGMSFDRNGAFEDRSIELKPATALDIITRKHM